jgi:hypothetical protein
MKQPGLLARLALRGVPPHLRESVAGDLLEDGAGAGEALAVALHFQAEPYRAAHDRRAVLLLGMAAAGLIWLVPQAAHSLLAQAAVFTDGFSLAALQAWRAPHLVAALAAGLWLGRASLLAAHADAARVHLALVAAPLAALAAPGAVQAALAAGLLRGAAWLAQQNRLAAPGPR